MIRNWRYGWIILASIIAVGVSVCAMIWCTQPMGDDLVYGSSWRGAGHWVRASVGYWFDVNGRGGDRLLMFAAGALPRWLTGIFCGFMTMVMLWSAVRCGARSALIAALMVGFMALGLPWWDYMTLACCQFNYVWATAFALVAWLLIFGAPRRGFVRLLCMVFCFFAGTMHEAASLPLLIGMVYLALRGRHRYDRAMLVCFGIGVLVVVTSPALWSRAGNLGQADDPLVWLMLKSDALGLILYGIVIFSLILRTTRKRMQMMLSGPFGAWTLACGLAMAISAVSGVVGRSGWFAEVYALIALVLICEACDLRLSLQLARICTYLICAVVIAQSAAVAVWAIRLKPEHDAFVAQYAASPDGAVWLDATSDDELPWYTLGRLRGVPDADDEFLMECATRFLRSDTLPAIVLPVSAQKLDWSQSLDTTVGKVRIAPTPSPNNADSISQPLCKGKRLHWVISRRVVDPGDRLHDF